MSLRTEWETGDFEEMSWHDVHIHGFRIEEKEGDNGTAELIFDIDYILEWVKNNEGFSFVVAQASLHFHDVFGLKFSLDYAKQSAGMSALSIEGISRERINFPNGNVSYNWKIEINWPYGEIEFESPGFDLTILGQTYTQPRQSLRPSQRNSLNFNQ